MTKLPSKETYLRQQLDLAHGTVAALLDQIELRDATIAKKDAQIADLEGRLPKQEPSPDEAHPPQPA